MMPSPHKGVAIILAGGPPPHMGQGMGQGDDDDSQIALPSSFDLGGAKPGDTLTVQVEGKLSEDGKSLIPMAVDGHKLGSDDGLSDDSSDANDDGPSPADKWQEMFGKH